MAYSESHHNGGGLGRGGGGKRPAKNITRVFSLQNIELEVLDITTQSSASASPASPSPSQVVEGIGASKNPVDLFGFQWPFVNYGLHNPAVDHLVLGVSGGRGSCKTFASVLRAVLYCLRYPGCVGLGVGLTEKSMDASIMPVFRKVCKSLGLQERHHWEHNIQKGVIYFPFQESTIFLRTAEHPERLPGVSLAFFFLDEFHSMTESIFVDLIPSLRQSGGYPRQAWMTSTPADPGHWYCKYMTPKKYARDFETEATPIAGWDMIPYIATTEDASKYPHLSGIDKMAFEGMLSMFGGRGHPKARQQLFGEWIAQEGLKYPTWNPSYHIKSQDEWVSFPKVVVAGVDFGYEHPASIVVEGVDESGKRRYLLDEFKKSHCEERELVVVAKKLMRKHDISHFLCDPEDARWLAAMRRSGLPVTKAKKNRSYGFAACSAALASKYRGEQAFFVSPHMKQFKREIENYILVESKPFKDMPEEPRKFNDDLMDAWRYAETFISSKFSKGTKSPMSILFKVV